MRAMLGMSDHTDVGRAPKGRQRGAATLATPIHFIASSYRGAVLGKAGGDRITDPLASVSRGFPALDVLAQQEG